MDAADLFRKTAGKPFYVTEVLAAGDATIPTTVRDAVLSRAARLPPAAMAVLEAVAIVPAAAELWLLEGLVGATLDGLDACLSSGMLATEEGAVTFRHELARLAIDASLTPVRKMSLHRQALSVLVASRRAAPDLARLVHHADGAGDAEAVARWAPAAAERAAALGSHREATAQYAAALRYAAAWSPAERAELLERQAHESYLADLFDISISAGREAVTCFSEAGDRLREGAALRQLSHHLRCTGQADDAEAIGHRSVAVLEQLAPGRELALAYSNGASISMNADDAVAAADAGRRALALATELDDTEALIHTLNTLGTVDLLAGNAEGRAGIERSLELALEASLDEHVGRAFVNLGWAANRSRSYAGVDTRLQAGIDYCSERGLVLWRYYLLAYKSRVALDQGRWSEAIELTQQVLRDPRTMLARVPALVVLALIRARRGDPDCWTPADEALALAEPTGELQHLAPVAAARAELAWLTGQPASVDSMTQTVLELAIQRRASWAIGELDCWRWRVGLPSMAGDEAAEPYAAEMAGDSVGAAEIWAERGCPYEAALARSGANDETVLRQVLSDLHDLGAHATAGVVARRLRESGARQVPRGPRPASRANPANLTTRELEVLKLLAEGLRNAEVASHLYLSTRTVEHHISALLAKLNVGNRADAITAAARLGLLDPTGEA
jgi:DNA-binding CsgD family transcriptional regulator